MRSVEYLKSQGVDGDQSLDIFGDISTYNSSNHQVYTRFHRKPQIYPTSFKKNTTAMDRKLILILSMALMALGMTAPAQGLELTKVYYPDEAFVHPTTLRWHK